MARNERWSALLAAGMLLAATAQAQQASTAEGPAPVAPVAPDLPPVPEGITTLSEVRALKPEDAQPLDLYRFKNPVQVRENRFSRDWSEPPTPEQVSMSGGYVMMGVVKGMIAAAKGVNRLTGGPDPIQPASARPPPALSEDQRRRAAQFCAADDCGADN